MTDFGTGSTLKEASPWLRDTDSRTEQIFTVTEINSVVKGLPSFQGDTRERIRQRLTDLSLPAPVPKGALINNLNKL